MSALLSSSILVFNFPKFSLYDFSFGYGIRCFEGKIQVSTVILIVPLLKTLD